MHFIERLRIEVTPIFMQRFCLSFESSKSSYIVEMYFFIVLSDIGHWINDDGRLALSELSVLISDVLTEGVLSQIK